MSMTTFQPFAVNPGGTAVSNISVVPGTGFTGTVSLGCQVTTTLSDVTSPQCQVSPTTVQPSGSATVTMLSLYNVNDQPVNATPGTYTVVITGTGSAGGTQQAAQPLTVLAVSPQFTITVQSPVLPSTVQPGNGGVGTININPVFSYQGTVTMSCASITPLVTVPPICQFSPNPVTISANTTTPTTLTITTAGPVSTTAVMRGRSFYALWLPLPMLALTGLGAVVGGKRSRKAWSLLALFILGGSLLLLPACNNLVPSKSTPNGITPNDTYTFTLMGVDQNGNISSNTGTANTAPSVTLTVN